MGKRIAIFDFDGTLFPFETFPFLIEQLKRQKGFRSRYYTFLIQFLVPFMKYKLKRMPKQRMRELALQDFIRLFMGLTENEIYHFFESAYEDMKDRVNKKVLQELIELKERGYLIVLVSGAVKPLLDVVSRDIPFDIVIGSRIPIANGMYEERDEIVYIQGNKKVQELHQALQEFLQDEVVNWEDSIAFADSESDLPVLEIVGNPVCVAPDEHLKQVAIRRNWRMVY